MDAREPRSLRAQGRSLSQRFEGYRVGADRAAGPAGQGRRSPARGGCPRGAERGSLCSGDRLPVARAAQGFAAQVHGARLSDAVGLGWHAGAHSPRALPQNPGSGRLRGLAQRRATADAARQIGLVKRSAQAKGVEALVVERTIARINRCRRLAKDDEYLNRTAVAFIRLARIGLMPRRLTRYRYSS